MRALQSARARERERGVEKFCCMSVQPGDANYGRFHRRPLPASCLDMSGAPAQALFAAAFSAGFAKAFFPLVSQFRTQDEPSYCGISTLVMCLNALAVDPGQVRCRQHLFFFRSRSLLPPPRSAAAAHTRTQRKLTPYFNIARYSTSNPPPARAHILDMEGCVALVARRHARLLHSARRCEAVRHHA